MMSYNEKKERSIIKNRLEESRKRGLDVNNFGVLRGIVCDELELSHRYLGVRYYKTIIKVIRPNIENTDYVPVVISKKLIPDLFEKIKKGKFIEIYGEFRSQNKMGDDGKSHVKLFMFAHEVNSCKEDNKEYANNIYLRGFVCKNVVFRETPFGTEIADLILAVNRFDSRKPDYIPCIAWWKNARAASHYEIGKQVEIFGRIQSRVYCKKIGDSEEKKLKEVYEVSIINLEEVGSNI